MNTEALKKDESWRAHLDQGKELFCRSEITAAERALNKALMLAPHDNATDESYADIYFSLALCAQAKNELINAEQHFNSALKAAERSFGANSPQAIVTKKQLASLYKRTRQLEKMQALQLLLDGTSIKRNISGRHLEDTLIRTLTNDEAQKAQNNRAMDSSGALSKTVLEKVPSHNLKVVDKPSQSALAQTSTEKVSSEIKKHGNSRSVNILAQTIKEKIPHMNLKDCSLSPWASEYETAIGSEVSQSKPDVLNAKVPSNDADGSGSKLLDLIFGTTNAATPTAPVIDAVIARSGIPSTSQRAIVPALATTMIDAAARSKELDAIQRPKDSAPPDKVQGRKNAGALEQATDKSCKNVVAIGQAMDKSCTNSIKKGNSCKAMLILAFVLISLMLLAWLRF